MIHMVGGGWLAVKGEEQHAYFVRVAAACLACIAMCICNPVGRFERLWVFCPVVGLRKHVALPFVTSHILCEVIVLTAWPLRILVAVASRPMCNSHSFTSLKGVVWHV